MPPRSGTRALASHTSVATTACIGSLGDAEIMLHPGGGKAGVNAPTIHVAVASLDELFERARRAGLEPFDHQNPDASLSAPVLRPWGDREFELADPDGQVWAFTEGATTLA